MAKLLKNKTIVIFGYGAQGAAHSLNLQESGFEISVCIPESSLSIADIKASKFNVITDPKKAAALADIVAFMVPDGVQKNLYSEIEDSLKQNATIIFAHGLNIHYELIKPRADLDIILVGPLAHGSAVRRMFTEKQKVPMMLAVAQNVTGTAWQIAREYAVGIGSSEERMIETTFEEETETDLFAEQALICGGLWRLISTAFETLVEEGYSPDIAYYCCLKETNILSEMFARLGIFGTFKTISDTARFGALSRGPKIIGDQVKEEMKKTLKEIKSGSFMKDLQKEMKNNSTKEMMQQLAEHKLELIHKKLSKG